MAHTELAVSNIVQSGVVLPAGTTGLIGGHKFQNDGHTAFIILNGGSPANAVATISLGAATPADGSYALLVGVFGQYYLTAAIDYNALKAAIATAVLAAKNVLTGAPLSADFPAATCVGGGTDLPTGPVTLTFGGAGVTGLADTPISVAIDSTLTTSGTYSVAVTTPGVGVGRVTFEGVGVPNLVEKIPSSGTQLYGPFNAQSYNQPIGATDAGEIYVDLDSQYASYTVSAIQIG